MRPVAELISRSRDLVRWYQARVPAWLRFAFVLGWAGLIWWLSSRPSVPHASDVLYSHVWNLGHVVVFGVLAGLILLSTQGCTIWWSVAAVVATAAYGVIDEMHQSTVPGRAVDAWDVCSDSIGACMTASGLHWLVRREHRAGILCLVCLPLAAASVHMASR